VILLVLGLAISIPLVIFGATLLVKAMERFPVIITVGAGLIGWVAGEMLISDLALRSWLSAYGVTYPGEAGQLHPTYGGMSLEWVSGALGVAIVAAVGTWLARKKRAETPDPNS
jgi:predicted tellurium resistance membrane protein TerC